ncbi:endoribonuclease [Serratia phage 92A1]|nr:endoribonuclease [Serratia phage 92A1]
MSLSNPDIYIRRQKLRRMFESEFQQINTDIVNTLKSMGSSQRFHVKYHPHFLDRVAQREIEEKYVFDLFKKLPSCSQEVIDFLLMPPLPATEEDLDPEVNYRPLRLELTDGTLWLGMTVDRHPENCTSFGLTCRMGFINSSRLKGKISTKVIKVT